MTFPFIHNLVSPIGIRLEGHVSTNEYNLSFELAMEDVEKKLREAGYYRNPFSYKTFIGIDGERTYSKGSWVKYTEGILGSWQVHITLYSAWDDGFVDVYSHYERSWIRHPIKHKNGEGYQIDKAHDIVFDDFENFTERGKDQRYEPPSSD